MILQTNRRLQHVFWKWNRWKSIYIQKTISMLKSLGPKNYSVIRSFPLFGTLILYLQLFIIQRNREGSCWEVLLYKHFCIRSSVLKTISWKMNFALWMNYGVSFNIHLSSCMCFWFLLKLASSNLPMYFSPHRTATCHFQHRTYLSNTIDPVAKLTTKVSLGLGGGISTWTTAVCSRNMQSNFHCWLKQKNFRMCPSLIRIALVRWT